MNDLRAKNSGFDQEYFLTGIILISGFNIIRNTIKSNY